MKLLALGATAALLTVHSAALAQRPETPKGPAASATWTARDGWLIVGAERLFGLHVYSTTLNAGQGAKSEQSGTMLSVFYGQSAINDDEDTVNPYAIPRIGADIALGKGFTIGGNLGFGVSSGTRQSGDTEEELISVSSFAAYARFGYLIALSESFAIWLRGGPEYYSTSHDDTEDGQVVTTVGFAAGLDPQLVITPAPHAAILLGPLIDLGIWGKTTRSTESNSVDAKTRSSSFGVTGGLALIF